MTPKYTIMIGEFHGGGWWGNIADTQFDCTGSSALAVLDMIDTHLYQLFTGERIARCESCDVFYNVPMDDSPGKCPMCGSPELLEAKKG